ncbi:MAG: trypsin-like peptidase domain-containing protein [Dehalococcoidia bacterium]|uniref:S1C family serine protease n=1 Tax=Candidatus Amarobacter glycogenicus TaxID=3140699 RepID=UPI003136279A|nr:trypsin-like peptidase domain-containing protein [Dehalococcoidia bacterium]
MSTESTTLAQVSAGFAAAVETAGASTVLVNARRRIPASGVVWSADGTIVTAHHVIERDEIEVVLADGSKHQATVAGRDPGSDIAVLKIGVAGLTPALRAPAGSAKVGNLVLAVGRPSLEGPMASLGVVGAIGGPWRTFRGGEVEGYIRTDTTFFPGFSGGPLVDAEGRVVGINSARLGRGAGLTVPVAAVERIAADLLAGGQVRRAYLGISSQVARLPVALAALAGGRETGLLIISVEPDSPADAAGVLIGDILIELGGQPVDDTDSLQAQLGPSHIGQATPASVLRGGERKDLTVTIGERS